VQGQHVTVQEIREYFKDREIAVGTTTIYRQLEKMVKDGLVEKYVVEGTNSACFEYIGESETSDYESCYHCKCEKCGKLIHLHCEDVVKLEQHLMDSHGFRMDPCRTVFYGICEECRGLEDDKKETETVHIRAK
jgi:Fur family ferric uptake transcriptional regulator